MFTYFFHNEIIYLPLNTKNIKPPFKGFLVFFVILSTIKWFNYF